MLLIWMLFHPLWILSILILYFYRYIASLKSSPIADSSTTKVAPYSCLAKKELRLLRLLALERHKAKAAKCFFLV